MALGVAKGAYLPLFLVGVILTGHAHPVQCLVLPTFERGVALKHPFAVAPSAVELGTFVVQAYAEEKSEQHCALKRCTSDPVDSAVHSIAPRFEDLFAALVLAAFAFWVAASSQEATVSEIELTTGPQLSPPQCKPDVQNAAEDLVQDHQQVSQPTEQQQAAVSRESDAPPCPPADGVDAPSPPVQAQEEQLLKEKTLVMLSGIGQRPELNGQVGEVVSSGDIGDDGERRYTIRVGASLLKLRASKLSPLSEKAPNGAQQEETAADTAEEAPQAASPTQATDSGKAAASQMREGSYVRISGLESRPELNGEVGLVVSIDSIDGGGERRCTIEVGASMMLRLRESKLLVLSATEYLQAVTSKRRSPPARSPTESSSSDEPPSAKSTVSGSDVPDSMGSQDLGTTASQTPPPPDRCQPAQTSIEAKLQAFRALPMGQLSDRGVLIPSYTWVKVPAIARLPPGMEIWMPPALSEQYARIPVQWKLQVVAEGQVDSYRCDVGEHTLLADVRRRAAAAFGWEEVSMELLADGVSIADSADPLATVGSAALFGRKLTARR